MTRPHRLLRREFLKHAGAGDATAAFPSVLRSASARQDKPNVLFVLVDDMNTVGAFCGGPALTPHLSQLATRGVTFNRAYCQFPWCIASCSSPMTGLRPDQTRVFDLSYLFHRRCPTW